MPSENQVIAELKAQPAPLLLLLDAFHRQDDCLTPEALRAIADGLRMPLADLYGTVTFYHHLAQGDNRRTRPRVCAGPVCRLRGAEAEIQRLDSASAMPCAGRCDVPIPALIGDQTLTLAAGNMQPTPTSPLPAPNPAQLPECVFERIREPGRSTLAGYEAGDGFAAARLAWERGPDFVIQTLNDSHLAGRGGAGFPTGRKWQAVRDAPGTPKTIVCNADEGEPGCFKDRALLEHDPFAVIEGMLLAAMATGAQLGFIYLRYEYPEIRDKLEQCLAEARAAGYWGPDNRFGPEFQFDIYLRRGAGAYVCGEEGSLLNSLEGKHPFPRNRPPYPVTHGFMQKPTVVNNVETLAATPHILLHGADWYRALGRGERAGTKVVSVSGDIERPGNYEAPFGLPLSELIYEWAGGPPAGRAVQAVTMAGLSGGFLKASDLDATLDEPSLRARGSMLGAGGMIVFDDTRDIVEVAHNAMEFFAHESCGKCFPCRIGTQRMKERLDFPAANDLVSGEAWHQEVQDLGQVMQHLSACGLGVSAAYVSDSLVRNFPDQVRAKLELEI